MALSDVGRMDMDMKALGLGESKEPLEVEMEAKVGELEAEEEGMYSDMSPVGDFSKAALNSLVQAHNSVSKLFGMEAYPVFESDMEQFPSRFTKEIMMIADAASDALEADVITEEMVPMIEGIKADRDVAMLAGKLSMLGKSKDFKKFLQEAPQEEEEMVAEEEVASEGEMSDDEMDQLMAERM